MSSRMPDAREVDRVEVLVTPLGDADTFLARCVVGSTWTARIRSAEVSAKVVSRTPLGTFDERTCSCVRLRLARPVPVEPGLKFQIADLDDGDLAGACLVRPWGEV